MDRDYLREEYKSLRSEIIANQERRAANERYGAGASVAIYAWLAVNSNEADPTTQPFLWFAWWLPVAIAAFGLYRQWVLTRGTREAGRYLADLQAALDIGDLGWERRLVVKARGHAVSRSSMYAWLAGLVLAFVIAVTATGMICSAQECGPTALNDLYGWEPEQ